MKHDKLMKEAFEGIEVKYKLDDTLEELGNQKLSSKQLEGFLIGKGVAPKEIKQSGVLKGFENDNRVMTSKENYVKAIDNTTNINDYSLRDTWAKLDTLIEDRNKQEYNTMLSNSTTIDDFINQLNVSDFSAPLIRDINSEFDNKNSLTIEANTRKVNMGTNDNASEATVKQYFADIESSGGNYKAFNKGSKAYGKYQITPIMMKDLGITMRDLNTPAKQEAIMSKLIPKYQSRLEQFNLPINKENMFVLHNLGMTGGIRVIKGNPTSEDITNMKYQLHGNTPKSTDNEIINNYAITYNLDK